MITQTNAPNGPSLLPFKPAEFPAIFRYVLGIVEGDVWKQRYLLATLPCVSAYADRLRAKYFIGEEVHAPLFQVMVVGAQASGKSYIRRVKETIMKRLEDADDAERIKCQRYKELSSKEREKMAAPSSVFRMLTASVSQASIQKGAGNMKLRYDDYLSFFYFSEEGTLLATSNRSSWSNMQEVFRCGFDFGSKFGNDRAHADSSSMRVEVRLNLLLSTTPSGIAELIDRRQVEQGTPSRIIPVFIDEPIGAKPPRIHPVTAEGMQQVDAVLDALWEETFKSENELRPEHWEDMAWLFPSMEKWCENQRKNAIEYQTRSYDSLYRRASVIGFRGSMLLSYLYHLDNQLFPKKIRSERWIRARVREFYIWLSDYVLSTTYFYWGEQMEAAMKTGDISAKKSKDLFSVLPNEFTTESLKYAMEKMGMKTEPKVRLSQWRSSHLILSEGNVHRKIS